MTAMQQNKTYFYFFLIVVFILGVIVLWPMRDILLLGFVITTVFRPVYLFLLEKAKFPKILATLTSLLTVLLTIMFPVSAFINISISQFKVFYRDLLSFSQGGNGAYTVMVDVFDRLNANLEKIPFVDYRVSVENLQLLIQQNVTPIANYLFSSSVDLGVGFAQSLPLIVMLLYVVWFGFPEYDRMIGFIKRLSPLSEKLDNLYLYRVTALIKGITKGTFVIALIQGGIASISLWIAGVPYVFFWFLVLVVFSVLPLGASFITFPIAGVLFLLGNYWQAIFLLLVQILFTSTIDNILRPYLIPKEAEVHPVLLLLSFIGGIKVFGIWGFLYGPLIMVMMMTTFEIYQRYYKLKE